MWHIYERGELPMRFWLGNLRERDHLSDLGRDGWIILKWIFKKWDWWHGMDWSGSGLTGGRCL